MREGTIQPMEIYQQSGTRNGLEAPGKNHLADDAGGLIGAGSLE
jgi:hypothetical protein